jgi:Ca2+-binding EF-hand superfamily protein
MAAFDTNKDGVLTKKEFSDGIKALDPESALGKSLIALFGVNWRAKSEVMKIFNEIDENHDGHLELEEIKHYITRLEESTSAQKGMVARRMSTMEDESKEQELFDRYKNKNDMLEFKDFARLWKELGSELTGKPFTNQQCNKWAKKTLKKLKNGGDSGVSFEEFKGLTASGPLFEIVTRRMVHN